MAALIVSAAQEFNTETGFVYLRLFLFCDSVKAPVQPNILLYLDGFQTAQNSSRDCLALIAATCGAGRYNS